MATLSRLYGSLVAAAVAATAAQGYTDVMQAKDGDPGLVVADAVTLGLLGAGIGVVSRLEDFLPWIERIDGSTVALSKISANRALAITKIDEILALDREAFLGPAPNVLEIPQLASAAMLTEAVGLVGTFVASTDALVDVLLPGVSVALIFVQTLRLLNGFGVPDKGEEFRDSAAAWSDVEGNFGQVSSSDAWVGVAADRYGELAASRQAGTTAVQEADRKLADILHAQAAQVQDAGIGLAAIDPICMLALPYVYSQCYALVAECGYIPSLVLNWKTLHTDCAARWQDGLPDVDKRLAGYVAIERATQALQKAMTNVYIRLLQLVPVVVGVMLVAGAATLTVLSILIDHGRKNAREIGSVTEIYRSAATAIAPDLSSGVGAGGVLAASVAPVVQLSEFGGGRSESFGPAALMGRLKG